MKNLLTAIILAFVLAFPLQMKTYAADTDSVCLAAARSQQYEFTQEIIKYPVMKVAQCCKHCVKGCPCGNTCISCAKECRVGPGCACSAIQYENLTETTESGPPSRKY